MDKIILNPKAFEKEFTYLEQNIKSSGYISLSSQLDIINQYVTAYFNPTESMQLFKTKRDVFNAEYALRLYIIKTCTNIDVDVANIDLLLSDTELWKKIVDTLSNYYELIEIKDKVVSNIEKEIELEVSLGNVLENILDFVKDALLSFSENFENLDDEKIEKMKSAAKEMSDTLAKSPLAAFAEEVEQRKKIKG